MPFINAAQADSLVELLPGQAKFPEPPKPGEKPGLVDTLAAGLRVGGNVLTAGYDRLWEPSLPEADPNYRPWQDIAGYEDFAKEFIRSGSPQETTVIKRRIDEALAASRTIDQAGGWGMAAAIAGGALSPDVLAAMTIPVAPVLSGATRAERIYAGVAGATALDTAGEAALQAQDPTRTALDAGLRVGAGALLTGALGHLVTRIPKAELEAARKQLQGDMKAPPDVGSDSVGAMRAGPDLTLDDVTIATKAGRFIAKTIGRIAPINRVLTSSSKKARILALEIADFSGKLNMNFVGKAITSLETRAIQREMVQRYGVNQLLDEAYTTYAKRVGKDAIGFQEFKVQASMAARRGDVHDIPEVASLARTVRAKILDPDKAELQKYGVLPEEIDLLGAKSYFPRVYDNAVIGQHGLKMREVLKRHFAGNPPDEIGPDGKMIPSKALDDVELKAMVEEVMNHIQGTTRGIADIATITVPGQLKKRVLNVPEELLEPFLVNDFELVMSGYIRAMAPQIEARKAGFTKMSFEDELKAVHDEYDALRTNAKSDKAIKALDDEEKAVLRDLKAIILRATNQVGPKGGDDFQNFVKAARMLRAYNYATKLGGQTLSSFSDFGHIATRYGAVKTNAALAKFLTNADFNKMTRADAKRMGVAVDWVLDSRSSTLAEVGDELGASKLERGIEWGTKKFTRYTGMATWNSVMKALTSALEQDQLVRYVQKMFPEGVGGAPRAASSTEQAHVDVLNRLESFVAQKRKSDPVSFFESSYADGAMPDMDRLVARYVEKYKDELPEDLKRALLNENVRDLETGEMLNALTDSVRGGHIGQLRRLRDEISQAASETSAPFNPNALKPFERAKLAEYGLGDEELKRVAKMAAKHADDSEGMWRLRTDEWEDRGAAEVVEQAISKAANIMVIRKGAGDLPLLMNKESMKTLFQFKSFGMAAVNRILIPVAQGLSYADAASANGFAMMLALGGMTYTAKEYAAGRHPDLSPGQVAKEALNWSGALGYIPDIWDPLTLGTPKSIRQDLRFSKFKDVSPVQTFLGPSLGTATDFALLYSGLGDAWNGVADNEVHMVRKAFLPMQNVFYLRRIIDALEGETAEAIGAEGATSEQFVDRITKTEEPKK